MPRSRLVQPVVVVVLMATGSLVFGDRALAIQDSRIEAMTELDPELPTFWKGTAVAVKARSYLLDRDRDRKQDNVGWALGGAVDYKSGWWLKRIRVGAVLLTSFELYGPEDKDGTQLFKPGPAPIAVLGEAFTTTRVGVDHGIKIGRQSFDLPYLSRHDIRMLPNTFEAVGIGRRAPQSGFGYVAGYVSRIKRKNDDEFIPLSEAAGAAAGTNKGMALLGGQYTFADGSVVGLTTQTTVHVMNTTFMKAERSFHLTPDVFLRGFVQYTDQRSVGDALIGAFATHLFAVKGELFYRKASFRVAASTAGNERGIQSPYGGPASYLSIIVDNFDRAGENAWMVGMSYDCASVGVEGLSFFTNIATGDTPDSGPNASPDETEYDVTVDYRLKQNNSLNGLWVRVRGTWIDQDEGEANGDDFFDFRVIVNYTVTLWR